MSRIYATPEIKKERAYQRAERLERELAPGGWSDPTLTIADLEVLADAWEEADFLGWADNYRAEAARRRGPARDPHGSHRLSRDPSAGIDRTIERLLAGETVPYGPNAPGSSWYADRWAKELDDTLRRRHDQVLVEGVEGWYAVPTSRTARDVRRRRHRRGGRGARLGSAFSNDASPTSPPRTFPLAPGVRLGVRPFPFGRSGRELEWFVFASERPGTWLASGEAGNLDEAKRSATAALARSSAFRSRGSRPSSSRVDVRKLVVGRDSSRTPRSASGSARRDSCGASKGACGCGCSHKQRDAARTSKTSTASSAQRRFISEKIRILRHEGYPQNQAIAIAYRMAGVPPRTRSRGARTRMQHRDPGSSPPPSGVRPRARAPKIETGYALARGVRERSSDWEDVIVDQALNDDARFVGFRRIDDSLHAVWRVGPVLYAQTAIGARHPSLFRGRGRS